jgi:serine/threonine protein kinase
MGVCSDQERELVEAHIAACEQCRQQIENARADMSDVELEPASECQRPGGSGEGKETPRSNAKSSGKPMPEELTASYENLLVPKVPDVIFEGYQILEELPRGGQAVVYKAIHKATKMKVALKVLLPGLTASAKARRYFKQEVELAARLSHPNIVAIRDSGIARGQHYFSMEYIRGQSLDRYISAKTLSFREKITLFNKICDAMTHAHQRGVIHRDLKPSNIMVDERDEPHVLDFGLAKTATGLSSVSESTVMPSITGQIKGTVAYMSPEQAAGRSDLVDVRTDVYSLGILLYHMFTGTFPYDVSGSAIGALHNIQSAEPVRPRHIISGFDSDVEAILLKCLEKDPNRRYQSAAELRDDIQRWLGGYPIVAKSVSSIYLLRKIVARHRYTSTVVALLTVIVLGFLISYGTLWAQSAMMKREYEERLNEAAVRIKELESLAPLTVLVVYFLPAWHSEDQSQRDWAAKYLTSSRGTREDAAVRFFLDSERSSVEKVAEYRAKWGEKEPLFTEFVIAETFLRDGSYAEAARGYQRVCLLFDSNSREDMLILQMAESRLHKLENEDPPEEASHSARKREGEP